MEKAVILAAGRGTRMEGLTEDRPKPMIPLRGKPMLEHILDRLRMAGFTQAFIVTGYKGELIEQHFRGYPMRIAYARQETIDGTARAALLARDWAGSDSFLLSYGDILTAAEEWREMARKLDSDPEAAGVAAVKWSEDPWQGAAVYEENGRLTRIIEKPAPGTSATHWNSAGSYCFRAEVFDELAAVPKSPRGEYELTSAVSQLIQSGRKVLLHAFQGEWRDVGRPSDLGAAEKIVSE
ncbi:MAG: sugar phosphate nucleotidyltransferase [Bryobacteraceae bacterium]